MRIDPFHSYVPIEQSGLTHDAKLLKALFNGSASNQSPLIPLHGSRPKPEAVLQNNDRLDEYKHDLEWQLKKGNIPQFLIEQGHWIGEGEGAASDKLIGMIRALLEELARKNNSRPQEAFGDVHAVIRLPSHIIV